MSDTPERLMDVDQEQDEVEWDDEFRKRRKEIIRKQSGFLEHRMSVIQKFTNIRQRWSKVQDRLEKRLDDDLPKDVLVLRRSNTAPEIRLSPARTKSFDSSLSFSTAKRKDNIGETYMHFLRGDKSQRPRTAMARTSRLQYYNSPDIRHFRPIEMTKNSHNSDNG